MTKTKAIGLLSIVLFFLSGGGRGGNCGDDASTIPMIRPTGAFIPVLTVRRQGHHGLNNKDFLTRLQSDSLRMDALEIDDDDDENDGRRRQGQEESQTNDATTSKLSPLEAAIRKATMISFIASMCLALPVTLFPVWLLSKTNQIDTARREALALDMGQWCARSLLFLMPFAEVTVQSDIHHDVGNDNEEESLPPSVWVCNHTSMLDTFILLACDVQLRGKKKRPIKTIYWKGLEDNPICNILFKLAGFIPVQMEANGAGEANQYDKKSFVRMLKDSKLAFDQGFDLLIFPEGQLNPWPEKGLLPVFQGAHKLAQRGRRPIRMVALYGCHHLWHADPTIGMSVTDKKVRARAYSSSSTSSAAPGGCHFETAEEFVETFQAVVGRFGATGKDLPPEELQHWLDGCTWKEKQEHRHNSPANSVKALEKEISKALESEKKNPQTYSQTN